jgi:hypothetical protein
MLSYIRRLRKATCYEHFFVAICQDKTKRILGLGSVSMEKGDELISLCSLDLGSKPGEERTLMVRKTSAPGS